MPKNEVRELNGYRLILMPEHPRSMKNECWEGYVYEHIVVAEESLGRPMRQDEVVHHLDGNRANNRSENILVLERSQHAKFHLWLNGGIISEKNDVNGLNSGKPKRVEPSYCKSCGRTLQGDQEAYCSTDCSHYSSRKVERPSKKELEREIKEKSFLELGRKYGVSDNAVRKWAKAYGLSW